MYCHAIVTQYTQASDKQVGKLLPSVCFGHWRQDGRDLCAEGVVTANTHTHTLSGTKTPDWWADQKKKLLESMLCKVKGWHLLCLILLCVTWLVADALQFQFLPPKKPKKEKKKFKAWTRGDTVSRYRFCRQLLNIIKSLNFISDTHDQNIYFGVVHDQQVNYTALTDLNERTGEGFSSLSLLTACRAVHRFLTTSLVSACRFTQRTSR